jgi:hypothetical protein
LGSIEREIPIKLYIEWVMPYPDFLPVILKMFLGQISVCSSLQYCSNKDLSFSSWITLGTD